MPYTKAQIEKILDKSGQSFVPVGKLNYAGRIAEADVRKRIYSWEDQSAFQVFHTLKDAFNKIKAHALDTAHYLGISTLANDAKGIQWRRDLLGYAEPLLVSTLSRVAYDDYESSTTAFSVGFYGRLFVMHSAMHNTVTVNKPRLHAHDVSAAVLHPTLTEALVADYGQYQQHGHEWQQAYNTVAQNTIVKLRRLTTGSLSKADTVNGTLTAIAGLLGVNGKPGEFVRGTYYEAQLLTRAAIMRSSNHGSAYAMRVQDDAQTVREAAETKWLLGAILLTSHDSRVCDICEPLDGKIYVINDLLGIALFGLPPDGTHYGCRCTVTPFLLPVDGEENTPPSDTWDDWMDAEDFGDDVGAFFAKTKLKSTQV